MSPRSPSTSPPAVPLCAERQCDRDLAIPYPFHGFRKARRLPNPPTRQALASLITRLESQTMTAGNRPRLDDILSGGGDDFNDLWNSTAAADEFEPLPQGRYTALVADGKLAESKA